MSLLPRDDRLVLPGIVLGGVLQLALCVTGQVDIGLVLCVYAAEAVVLVPMLTGGAAWDTIRIWAGAILLCIAAGLIGARAVQWSPWAIATAVSLWALTVGGWLWQAWERRVSPWRVVRKSDAALHFGVVAVGLIGMAWAHDHRLLVAHDWPGTGSADVDGGTRLVSWIIESGVAPLTVPAVLLVLFRTMNEVFLELWRMLGQSPSGSSSSEPDAPSSSRTTA